MIKVPEDKKDVKFSKRLVIDLSEQDHMFIKKKALMRNQTIRKYVLETLMIRLEQEKKYE